MRSRFIKDGKAPTLMLTSLLDMFTIILIFLIVSFEAESYDFHLNDKVKLPESAARGLFKPAVNLVVTSDSILVEQSEVAHLSNGEAEAAYHNAGEIPPLVGALRAQYERRFGHGEAEGADVQEGTEGELGNEAIIMVQSDRELKYRTLYLILRSAANAGFFKYRLAILRT